MKNSYILLLKEAFPTIQEVTAFPFVPTYTMAYRDKVSSFDYAASKNYQDDDFALILQCYNAPDAFVSLLEIDTYQALEIPIRLERDDMHWLFCLRGHAGMAAETLTEQALTNLNAREYQIVYAPERKYLLQFPAGQTVLLSITLKASWLLRKDVPYTGPIRELLDYLRIRSFEWVGSRILSINPLIHAYCLSLIDVPDLQDLRVDARVYLPVTELVVQSHRDLQENRKDKGSSLILVLGIHQYVRDQISLGRSPLVEAIAEAFQVSPQYINRIHRAHFGCGLKHYMHEQRMEEALRRLRSGYSPTEVATWLEYLHYKTFKNQFKRYHSLPPGEANISPNT